MFLTVSDREEYTQNHTSISQQLQQRSKISAHDSKNLEGKWMAGNVAEIYLAVGWANFFKIGIFSLINTASSGQSMAARTFFVCLCLRCLLCVHCLLLLHVALDRDALVHTTSAYHRHHHTTRMGYVYQFWALGICLYLVYQARAIVCFKFPNVFIARLALATSWYALLFRKWTANLRLSPHSTPSQLCLQLRSPFSTLTWSSTEYERNDTSSIYEYILSALLLCATNSSASTGGALTACFVVCILSALPYADLSPNGTEKRTRLSLHRFLLLNTNTADGNSSTQVFIAGQTRTIYLEWQSKHFVVVEAAETSSTEPQVGSSSYYLYYSSTWVYHIQRQLPGTKYAAAAVQRYTEYSTLSWIDLCTRYHTQEKLFYTEFTVYSNWALVANCPGCFGVFNHMSAVVRPL